MHDAAAGGAGSDLDLTLGVARGEAAVGAGEEGGGGVGGFGGDDGGDVDVEGGVWRLGFP